MIQVQFLPRSSETDQKIIDIYTGILNYLTGTEDSPLVKLLFQYKEFISNYSESTPEEFFLRQFGLVNNDPSQSNFGSLSGSCCSCDCINTLIDTISPTDEKLMADYNKMSPQKRKQLQIALYHMLNGNKSSDFMLTLNKITGLLLEKVLVLLGYARVQGFGDNDLAIMLEELQNIVIDENTAIQVAICYQKGFNYPYIYIISDQMRHIVNQTWRKSAYVRFIGVDEFFNEIVHLRPYNNGYIKDPKYYLSNEYELVSRITGLFEISAIYDTTFGHNVIQLTEIPISATAVYSISVGNGVVTTNKEGTELSNLWYFPLGGTTALVPVEFNNQLPSVFMVNDTVKTISLNFWVKSEYRVGELVILNADTNEEIKYRLCKDYKSGRINYRISFNPTSSVIINMTFKMSLGDIFASMLGLPRYPKNNETVFKDPMIYHHFSYVTDLKHQVKLLEQFTTAQDRVHINIYDESTKDFCEYSESCYCDIDIDKDLYIHLVFDVPVKWTDLENTISKNYLLFQLHISEDFVYMPKYSMLYEGTNEFYGYFALGKSGWVSPLCYSVEEVDKFANDYFGSLVEPGIVTPIDLTVAPNITKTKSPDSTDLINTTFRLSNPIDLHINDISFKGSFMHTKYIKVIGIKQASYYDYASGTIVTKVIEEKQFVTNAAWIDPNVSIETEIPTPRDPSLTVSICDNRFNILEKYNILKYTIDYGIIEYSKYVNGKLVTVAHSVAQEVYVDISTGKFIDKIENKPVQTINIDFDKLIKTVENETGKYCTLKVEIPNTFAGKLAINSTDAIEDMGIYFLDQNENFTEKKFIYPMTILSDIIVVDAHKTYTDESMGIGGKQYFYIPIKVSEYMVKYYMKKQLMIWIRIPKGKLIYITPQGKAFPVEASNIKFIY